MALENLVGVSVGLPETQEVSKAREIASGLTKESFFQNAIEKAWQDPKVFPREFIQEVAKYGCCALEIDDDFLPNDLKGAKMSPPEQAAVMSEFARVDAGPPLSLLVLNSLTAFEMNKFGTLDQKSAFLPEMAQAKRFFCYGLTEPDYGTDATNIQLKAKHDESKGGFIVNGVKRFITGASGADNIVLTTRTGAPDSGKNGMTVLLVDMHAQGVRVPEPYSKPGQPGSPLCEVYFDDVFVPDEMILGGKNYINRGWEIISATLNHSRNWIAAQGVGVAQACWDEAAAYSEIRKVRDIPLSNKEDHALYLRVLGTQINISRALTQLSTKYEAEGNSRFPVLASLAKQVACDTTAYAGLEGMMLIGGVGYTGLKITRHWLNSPILRIYEGTPFVQIKKVIIPGGISPETLYDLLPPKLSSGYLKNFEELVHPEKVDVAHKEWLEAGIPSGK